MQKCRTAGTQTCRHAEMQNCRHADMQICRPKVKSVILVPGHPPNLVSLLSNSKTQLITFLPTLSSEPSETAVDRKKTFNS